MYDISRPYSQPITEVLGKSRYTIAKLPAHLQQQAARVWLRAVNVRREPTKYLGEYGVDISGADKRLHEYLALYLQVSAELPIDTEASLDEIREFAEKVARQFDEGIYIHKWTEAYLRERAESLSLDWEILADKEKCGVIGRLLDKHFWNRQLGKNIRRASEHIKRAGFNEINKRKQLYCSDKAVYDRKAQKHRLAALMQQLVMINELGQEFSLAELVEKSNANSRVRFAEMMTRVKGFEWFARECNHVGEFITMTCPSRFHSALAVSGSPNPKYDGSTPRDAAAYLGSVWARIQSELKRNEIEIYGFRVAEPHHDGCPHWHGLFFMKPEQVHLFRRIVAKHTCRENREELGLFYFDTKKQAMAYARQKQAAQKAAGVSVQTLAELSSSLKTESEFWDEATDSVFKAQKVNARVHFEAIDWSKGSAAGYIVKYIAKNIDGKNQAGEALGEEDFEAANGERMIETAERVDAWASLWGIRQFQQIGGVPVGIWRELRRENMTTGDSDDIIVRAALAADKGDWGKFVVLMGGASVKRADLPVQLYKERVSDVFTNKYGEPLPAFTRGVVDAASGEIKISRIHEWRLAFKKGGDAAPWTRVNNSTKTKYDEETMDCIVNKSKETLNNRENRRAVLLADLRKLARENNIEPYFKAQEMMLLNSALAQLSREPEIDAAQSEKMLQTAQVQADRVRNQEDKRRALREYQSSLNDLAQLMQPRLDSVKPEYAGRISDRMPPKLRKFAAPKKYDCAESVLREAADLLDNIRKLYQ